MGKKYRCSSNTFKKNEITGNLNSFMAKDLQPNIQIFLKCLHSTNVKKASTQTS